MVPPEAFSTAAPQSSSAFCKGCEAGTQCDSFSSKVFSWAKAGDTAAATTTASNAFLINVSPSRMWGFSALCGYCYRITSSLQAGAACGMQPQDNRGSEGADTGRNHRRGTR